MSFTIKALPHEVPLTTMDEHWVIGGKYFDVLNGTYELEKLNDKTCRLHLWSNFKLTTTFNFYASWLANNIMKTHWVQLLKLVDFSINLKILNSKSEKNDNFHAYFFLK